MKLLGPMLAVAAAASLAFGQEPESPEGCITCHGQQGREHRLGAHAQAAITCVTCHGGVDGELDEAAAHGEDLVALTEPLASVESCGGCHSDAERMHGYGLRTDQLAQYWTSRHGIRVAEDGDPNVATCADCHGAHGILRAADPRSSVHKLNQTSTCGSCHSDSELMGKYGIADDVMEEYGHSVHGRALLEEGRLSSPGCIDCHGSHGAMPPRTTELGRVCGNCHSVVQQHFERGPHQQAVLRGEMDECTSCHDNHRVGTPSVSMFLGSDGEGGTCGLCHQDADDPGLEIARSLQNSLESFDQRLSETQATIRESGARGIFIADERGYLDDARSLRARARAATHALSPEELEGFLSRGEAMIDVTLESLEVKSRELRDRKIYTKIFLVVVLLLVGMILIYRREIAGPWRDTLEGPRNAGGSGP